MTQQRDVISEQMGRSRTTLLVFFAVGLVLAAAVASGFLFNMHERAWYAARLRTGSETSSRGSGGSEANVSTPITNDASDKVPQERLETMQEQSAAPTSSNISNTTITVNGETTSISGPGSVYRSYKTPDGVKVHISIDNKVEQNSR